MDKYINHRLGNCFYDKDKKLCYVNIPKIASISIRRALGWQQANFITARIVGQKDNGPLDIDTYIVVLRDPISRYKSMINYASPAGDEHYETQSYFVDAITEKDKIKYFWLTDNILSDINDYFKLNIDVTLHRNRSSNNRPISDEFVKEAYQVDYDLISSVQFINGDSA